MLRITFINVGYGDSILLEEMKRSKNVFTMLIDAGTPYEDEHRLAYDEGTGRRPPSTYLAEHGIEKLDVIFLTHFHIDHVGGIPAVMREVRFGEVWANYRLSSPLPPKNRVATTPGRPESVTMLRSLELLADAERLVRANGSDIKPMVSHRFGESLTGDISADIYAVAPEMVATMDRLTRQVCDGSPAEAETALYALDRTQNASCAAMRITYKGRSALLAADLPHTYWNPLIEAGRPIHADILKFAHHGHADGASPEFARSVSPGHVVFSVSSDNTFGCPKPSAIASFPGNVRFHATEAIDMPPALVLSSPRGAVVFEISDDGGLRWGTEAAGSPGTYLFD